MEPTVQTTPTSATTSTEPPLSRGPRVSIPVLVLGLALASLPTWLPWVLGQFGLSLGWGPPGILVWNWLAVGLLALHIWRVEGLNAASLRLVRPSQKDIEWAGWIGGAVVGWHWLSAKFLPASMEAPEGSGGASLIALGPLLALALVITAATTEEVLLRGYVVERLGAWIGPLVAAILGLTLFALGHVPFFGTGWLITGLPAAIALYALLLWRRNLWACIFCHFIVDVPVFIMSVVGAVNG